MFILRYFCCITDDLTVIFFKYLSVMMGNLSGDVESHLCCGVIGVHRGDHQCIFINDRHRFHTHHRCSQTLTCMINISSLLVFVYVVSPKMVWKDWHFVFVDVDLQRVFHIPICYERIVLINPPHSTEYTVKLDLYGQFSVRDHEDDPMWPSYSTCTQAMRTAVPLRAWCGEIWTKPTRLSAIPKINTYGRARG